MKPNLVITFIEYITDLMNTLYYNSMLFRCCAVNNANKYIFKIHLSKYTHSIQ